MFLPIPPSFSLSPLLTKARSFVCFIPHDVLFVRSFSNVYTKSVKFVEHPSPDQLRRQLELVAKSLIALCEHAGDLDLMLTIAVTASSPAASAVA